MIGSDVKDANIPSLALPEDGLTKLRISKRDWLYLIKLFELEISARKASKEIEL